MKPRSRHWGLPLKSNAPELLLLLTMASIILLMIYVNNVVTYVGSRELEANLLRLSQANVKRDFIGMVSKYKLQKDLYDNKIDDGSLAIEELKVDSIIASRGNLLGAKSEPYKYELLPALFVINAVRFLLNEKPIVLETELRTHPYLDIAYYYERNKAFKNALDTYQKALGSLPGGSDNIPIIQLHQGFCSSIIGDYSAARKQFKDLIKADKNEGVTKTAKILLQYINDMEQEINKVLASNDGAIEKGQKLFKLMAYNKAIDMLDTADPKNQQELETAQYYKARATEENGDTKKSVEIYQDLITQNPKSNFAKQSNKRILAIGARDPDNGELKQLADKNNQAIGDADYTKYAQELLIAADDTSKNSLEDILSTSNLSKEEVKNLRNADTSSQKENREFITEIVTAVVKENQDYKIRNTVFYEQAIKKLEEVKSELETNYEVLEQDKQRMESQLAKLKSLEKQNAALKAEKQRVEKQLSELQNNVTKPGVTAAEALTQDLSDNSGAEIVTNKDQFDRIITRYSYRHNESGKRYVDSYSIYYYQDNGKLYKVVDFDGNNIITAYYLIVFDETDKQVKIKKYDPQNNLMYVK